MPIVSNCFQLFLILFHKHSFSSETLVIIVIILNRSALKKLCLDEPNDRFEMKRKKYNRRTFLNVFNQFVNVTLESWNYKTLRGKARQSLSWFILIKIKIYFLQYLWNELIIELVDKIILLILV